MKKKDILKHGFTGVFAIALLMGGASYAYLQSSTNTVINNFSAYIADVGLTESGNQMYDIIPGTTAVKDPRVTVKQGLPLYVFVEVEDTVNQTGVKLVDYKINPEWTKLDSEDNVYYVQTDGLDTYTYEILKDNQVSYSSELVNEDMVISEDGMTSLKQGMVLSFQAFAIQKEPFQSAQEAYNALKNEQIAPESIEVNNSEDLNKVLADASQDNLTIILEEGNYELYGAVISGNNVRILCEKGAAVIHVKDADLSRNNEAAILVSKGNVSFDNLTFNLDASSTRSFLKAENASVSMNRITVNNKIDKPVFDFDNSSVSISKGNIEHTGAIAAPAIVIRESDVMAEDVCITVSDFSIPQYELRQSALSEAGKQSRPSSLRLNRAMGISYNSGAGIKVVSQRNNSLNSENMDHVFWNDTEIAQSGIEGFMMLSTPEATTYIKYFESED